MVGKSDIDGQHRSIVIDGFHGKTYAHSILYLSGTAIELLNFMPYTFL